jgi:histidine triad (HIT) family protein
VFCAIVAGTSPAQVVGESERALAFLDIAPAAEGHVLVVPKVHADDIWDLDPDDGIGMWSLTQDVARLLLERLRPEGLTLFQANRRAGWQDVFHLHTHLVPRRHGDGLVKPWGSVPGDPSELERVALRLRGS